MEFDIRREIDRLSISCQLLSSANAPNPANIHQHPANIHQYPANTNQYPANMHQYPAKVGAILKKVLIEAIPMLYYLGKVSIKRLYRCKSQKFLTMKRYKYFYAKNLNRQTECIVSNSRIFKGEAIQVLLRQKNEWSKRLCCFKPQNI